MRHVSSIVPGLSADVQQLYWAKDALLAGSDALIHPPEGGWMAARLITFLEAVLTLSSKKQCFRMAPDRSQLEIDCQRELKLLSHNGRNIGLADGGGRRG